MNLVGLVSTEIPVSSRKSRRHQGHLLGICPGSHSCFYTITGYLWEEIHILDKFMVDTLLGSKTGWLWASFWVLTLTSSVTAAKVFFSDLSLLIYKMAKL